MSRLLRTAPLVLTLALASGCESEGVSAPFSQTPVLTVAPSVPATASSLEVQVTNLAHHYITPELCGYPSFERLESGEWTPVAFAPRPQSCTGGPSFGGFMSTRSLPVPLSGATPPGEYRARMRFTYKSREFRAISNTFVIE